MKYLILIMFLFGCGFDPDDYKPEEPDGCKSYDTQCQESEENVALEEEKPKEQQATENTENTEDTDMDENGDASLRGPTSDETNNIVVNAATNINVIIGVNGEQIPRDNADNCMAGRLCRGSTKAEVLALIGQPNALTKKDPFEVWRWEDFSGDSIICNAFMCEITFRDGLIVDQDDIDAEWLDLENF